MYRSPNILRVIKIKKNEMGGACSEDWDGRGVCRVLLRKTEKKTRPLGRPRRRGEDNIKANI
jgi:hypothetical protein